MSDHDIDPLSPEYLEASLRASAEGVAYMPDGRPIFSRRGDETDADYRSRIMATLAAKRPPTPKEIVENVIHPGRYTMAEDDRSLTAEITCPDLTAEEERAIAGRFPLVWTVTINGRSAWEILNL